MKRAPARLGIDTNHAFHGSAIDRSHALQFKLNGRVIHGFAGDTILSAVLAAGIDTAGLHISQPIALSTRHAPAIAARATPSAALPMERTLATDGAEYDTLARPARSTTIGRVLRRPQRSLGLDLDSPQALSRPWLEMSGQRTLSTDVLVIGGGVAGMAAALAAAKRGRRVILAEATPRLGGHARLFGTQEGEETPDHAIARLGQAIAQKSELITVLTATEAFALRPGIARLHRVTMASGQPIGDVIDVESPNIVLATGTIERLPIFSGNRLPGVVGALEAFDLAHHYGVWPGRSAVIATSNSPAYRLAMLAQDAGIGMRRIVDSRPQPQSRFIEFSKAYGITLAAGTLAAAARPASKGPGLDIMPQSAMEGLSRTEEPILADRLIACGGWQPDLTLWHMAGGQSAWHAAHARLEQTAPPPGIGLAGCAAGWFTRRAAITSGSDAVHALLGLKRVQFNDPLIDALYETPDGATPVAAMSDDAPYAAFLDGGMRYLARPRILPSRWPTWLPFGKKADGWSLADSAEPLDIAGIAAGVQLGAIPAASAGIVAQERVAMVGMTSAAVAAPPVPLAMPPAFLGGRYPGATLMVVEAQDTRQLEIGTLIYANTDSGDPLSSIGVVVRSIDGVTVALVAALPGTTAHAGQPGRSVPIRLVAPWHEKAALDATLGGGASAF